MALEQKGILTEYGNKNRIIEEKNKRRGEHQQQREHGRSRERGR